MSKHHDTFDSIYAFIRCMSRSTHNEPSSGNNGNHWLAGNHAIQSRKSLVSQ
jgi:hypothetical protein